MAGLVSLLFFCPTSAAAVGEEELQLSLGAGYGWLAAGGRRGGGVALFLEGHRGLSDTWAVRVGLGASWHPSPAGSAGQSGGSVRSIDAVAGLTYAYDVFRLVPLVDLAVAAVDIGGDVAQSQRALGFEGGVGGEYLLSPRWVLGLLARAQYFPLQSSGAGDGQAPWALRLGLRLGRIF